MAVASCHHRSSDLWTAVHDDNSRKIILLHEEVSVFLLCRSLSLLICTIRCTVLPFCEDLFQLMPISIPLLRLPLFLKSLKMINFDLTDAEGIPPLAFHIDFLCFH